MGVREEFSIDQMAWLLSGALFAILVALLLIPHDQAYMLRTFTPEHIEMNQFFDSRGQQMAHRLLVGMLGALGLLILWLRPFSLSFAPPRPVVTGMRFLAEYPGLLLIIVIAALVAVNRGRSFITDSYIIQGRYYALALLPSLRTQAIVTALAAIATIAVCAAARKSVLSTAQHGIARAVIYTLVAYAAILFALGLVQVPDFLKFTPQGLAAVEWHYSGNLGAGDQLATGMALGDVAIYAGTLSAIVLGIVERIVGLLSFGDHIRLVMALQAVFFLAAAIALWKWYGRRWGATVLAILLLLPWIEPLHAAALYPNQSAWRFLGFAVGVLLLVITYRRSPRDIAGQLGLAAGFAVAWNTETGICLCAAYATFLVLRSTTNPRDNNLVGVAARFTVGIFVAISLIFIVVRLGLGYWPSASAISESFRLIGQFSAGYGGLKLAQIDPLAVLIFVHALWIVVRGLLQWAKGPVSARFAFRITLATLILLWAAYYFKAPHFWNLWSFLFLYGFLLGDLLPLRLTALSGLSGRKLATSFRATVVILILIPAAVFSNTITLRSAMLAGGVMAKAPGCADGKIVSGICLSLEVAAAVEHKASSLLSALSGSGDVLYMTSNSYLMPLLTTGFPRVRQRDPFLLTISNSEFELLVAEIMALRPACLLFDAPNRPLSGSVFHHRFYQRVRSALTPAYRQKITVGDWEYWCRTGDDF